ncbi:hypothetical protein [Rubripirellula lacrimiformis]|uniref:hypothetical protein n=1 Tax=Rubripirellula lacrimiformis TaxID=1930273 RepID=UPI001C54CDD5|nr:hypothetical protein [Rubripirellula lacrimiformis]
MTLTILLDPMRLTVPCIVQIDRVVLEIHATLARDAALSERLRGPLVATIQPVRCSL